MEKEISIKVNARHVGQLGRELVTDYVTALTELVKNSYDADGEGVEVAFTNMLSGEGKIIIADTGCGFSSDDIETKWAVIGTSSKVKNPYSKKYKRRCVGRKGIGRYSVERLAEYCTLYSFTKDNRPVKYYMNWNKYEGIDFNELKQRVEILENSPDFESAKYIKRAVEYLLVSERIDIDSKNIIREKILKNNKLDFSIFYSKETLGNIQQFLYPIYEKYNGIEERVEDIKNVVEELEGEEKELYYNKLRTLYKKIGKNKEQYYTGTFLILDSLRDNWKKEDIEKVIKEFRLLVSPFEEKNNFSIYITAHVVQLIRYMADFYDSIRFPESSVVLREFSPEKRAMEKLHEKSVEYQQLMEQSGICATFHIFVKYRQNATWQGSVTWVEKKEKQQFRSALELLKLIESALDEEEGENHEK